MTFIDINWSIKLQEIETFGCLINEFLNFPYPFWNNNFWVLIIPYFNKENFIIQTNAYFLPITINDVLEFFDIFIPTSAMKPMLSLLHL